MKMWDIHHERLKHLVSTAVLELWKKETGSLSSVLIEGTICITAGSGRTTVLHLSDQFSASIPEHSRDDEGLKRSYHGLKRSFYGSSRSVYGPPLVDCKQETDSSTVQAYFDELSPASLTSPTEAPPLKQDMAKSRRKNSGESPVRSGNRTEENPMDSGIDIVSEDKRHSELSITQLKDEFLSDEESDSLNSSRNSATGPVIPGTGYYTYEGHKRAVKVTNNNALKDRADFRSSISSEKESDENEEDSIIEDRSAVADFSVSEGSGPFFSTPKHSHKLPFFADSVSSASKLNILDLRKREPDDLALSPPQNYTAQVRDVIRQRLLASSARNRSPDESLVDHSKLDVTKEGMNTSALRSSAKSLLELNNLPRFSPGSSNSTHNGPLLHSPASRPSSVPFPAFVTSSPTASPSPQVQEMFNAHARAQLQMMQASALGRENKSPMDDPALNNAQPSEADVSQSDSLRDDGNTSSTSAAGGDQKVYKCDFCSKTFLFKSKYHEHLPVHTNARPYQCRLCSRTYKYKYDLRVHLRTHMGIPTKSTVCPFCNAKFDTNKLLRLHIKDAHRERHRVTEEDCAQMYESVL